jgi:myo-inositol 2-dehydrogenase / D-chiro-inositol 1-dehydrogenase
MPTSLSVGLIGAGWIGRFHAETLAHRLPGGRLVAVADPLRGAAERLSAPRAFADPLELIADPAVDARNAQEIALAARESVETGAPVALTAMLR